jgi:biopolymer transport protein ExbB
LSSFLPTLLAAAPAADIWEVIFSGGVTGMAILGLLGLVSILALTLVVEHLLTIRRTALMPPGLAEQVQKQLAQHELQGAQQQCQQNSSALAQVLASGLAETAGGWPAVEKGMEESLAEQAARLLRKIDYLSVIGNIAPMIGLLGTVFGMIFAFQEVAHTQGAARAAELASGIYQALVTTVGGLLVAIPSLAAFAVFRNRIDQLIAETGQQAAHAIDPLKRRFQQPPQLPPGGP